MLRHTAIVMTKFYQKSKFAKRTMAAAVMFQIVSSYNSTTDVPISVKL